MLGDDDFVRFVDTRGPALLRTATFVTASLPRGADLLREALTDVYVHGRSLRGDPGLLESAVRNRLVQAALAEHRDDESAATTDPHPTPDGDDDAGQLWWLLHRLAPRERIIVTLRYHDERPDNEIAELVDSSVAGVVREADHILESRWPALTGSGLTGPDAPHRDDLVHAQFDAGAAQIPALALEFAPSVVEEGRLIKRRRHQVWSAWVAGAAVLAGIWVTTVVVTGRGGFDLSPSPDLPHTPRIHTAIDPIDWARDLPRGDDAAVAFVAQGSLFIGGRQLSLPPGHIATLEQPAEGGWLGVDTAVGRTGIASRTVGVYSPDGIFRPFAYQPRARVPGAAVSPDGAQVALGRAVVDIASGQATSPLPRDVQTIGTWTDQGLTYLDSHARTWLWTPGSTPSYIGRNLTFQPDGVGLDASLSCQKFYQLAPDATLSAALDYCGEPIVSVSPRHKIAITQHLDIIAFDTGSVADRMNFPRIDFTPCCNLHWEDDDHVIVVVGVEPDYYRDPPKAPFVLVRCTISTNSCERASEEFFNPTSPTLVSLPTS